jgi:hypothetical protein
MSLLVENLDGGKKLEVTQHVIETIRVTQLPLVGNASNATYKLRSSRRSSIYKKGGGASETRRVILHLARSYKVLFLRTHPSSRRMLPVTLRLRFSAASSCL